MIQPYDTWIGPFSLVVWEVLIDAYNSAIRTGIYGADLWAAVYAEAAAMEIAALRLEVLRLGQRIVKEAANLGPAGYVDDATGRMHRR